MKDFSILESALALSSTQHAPAVDRIANISRKDFQDRETFYCHTNLSSIEYACLMIENSLVLRTNRGGRVYAGLGRLSRFQSIIDRYLRIADVSEAVYLFGRNDWIPPRHPNVRIILLGDDFKLSRESFLIAESSTFNTAFIARKEDPSEAINTQQSYLAFKTSNLSIASRLTNAVEGVINWSLAA